MSPLTLENTKLELRRDEKGRFTLFFDGERVPGVMAVEMAQETPQRPTFTVTFAAVAVRVVEHEFDAVPDCEDVP
jgi:hypothetical protein